MTKNIQRLKDIGFEFAGLWKLDNGKIAYDLLKDFENKKDVLYAFVVNEEVKYVGKTTQTLKDRLGGYRNFGPTQQTNKRNNKNIKKALSKGDRVDIYVFVGDDKKFEEYKGFKLSLAAGLEDGINDELDPDWRGGKK